MSEVVVTCAPVGEIVTTGAIRVKIAIPANNQAFDAHFINPQEHEFGSEASIKVYNILWREQYICSSLPIGNRRGARISRIIGFQRNDLLFLTIG